MQAPVTCGDGGAQMLAKQAIRGRLRADRASRDVDAGTHAEALATVAAPHLSAAGTVALYVSMRHEPGTGPLRTTLARAGTRVLLPWLCDDGDLDWVLDAGRPAALATDPAVDPPTDPAVDPGPTARQAALWPPGRRLGVGAITGADAVVLPALAVDTAGRRLGQGGGSYDRVLARLAGTRPGPLLVACVFDEEVHDAATQPLPQERHDQRVGAILTPTRWLALGTVRDP